MRCPYCGHEDTSVIDSRDVDRGIRRRRQCLGCGSRFTTYERFEPQRILYVAKKDGRREAWKRDKVLSGVKTACEKRPISIETIEVLVDGIESHFSSSGEREVGAGEIGEMVVARLHDLDDVAYVRFASVYREFKDATEFMEELRELLKDKKKGRSK